MSTVEIIGLLLGSSLLSALLSSLIDWRLHAKNYKREYYKKLLDKRLDGYESVEALAREMGGLVQLEDGKLCPMVFASGEERWDRFLLSVFYASSKSFWLSSETSGLVTELNVFLMNAVSNPLDAEVNKDEGLVRIGTPLREDIRKRRNELLNSLYRDFSRLSDIPKFIGELRPDESYFVDPPSKRHA